MSLNTCEEHDSVVVYQGNRCPVCDKIADLKRYIQTLEVENRNLPED